MKNDAEAPVSSIIILTCNGLEHTRVCLQSVRRHTSMPYEIIVWDNGSAADEAATVRKEFPGVTAFRSPVNLGITGGNNAAARHAKGRYLVLLNNDTEVTPGWLEPLTGELDNDSSIAACQPKLLSWSERTHFDHSGGCGGFLDRFGYPFTRGRVLEHREHDRGQYDAPEDIHWGSAACLAVRRDLWEKEGGEDETFFAYMDEIDLCWRFRNNGYRIRCIPSAVVFHKGSAYWKQFSARQRFLCHRNNLLMIAKHTAPHGFFTVLVPRIVLDAAASLYYMLRGHPSYTVSVWLAICSFFLRLPACMRTRKTPPFRAPLMPLSIIFRCFVQGRCAYSRLIR